MLSYGRLNIQCATLQKSVFLKIFNLFPSNFCFLFLFHFLFHFFHLMFLFIVGLEMLKDMLRQFACCTDRSKAQSFYKIFFVDIVIHVLSVVTDSNQIKIVGRWCFSYFSHFFANKAWAGKIRLFHFFLGLSCYADVLCSLFYAAEFSITDQLNPPQSNMDFIYQRISQTFSQAFGNLTQ